VYEGHEEIPSKMVFVIFVFFRAFVTSRED